jgi:hypothetical protein
MASITPAILAVVSAALRLIIRDHRAKAVPAVMASRIEFIAGKYGRFGRIRSNRRGGPGTRTGRPARGHPAILPGAGACLDAADACGYRGRSIEAEDACPGPFARVLT